MNASAHIPDASDLAQKIKDKADKFHDGKVSAFVRSCIVKELEGSFAPTSDDALVDLARAFHPTLAPVIAEKKIKNPGRTIAKMLEALVEALDQKGFDAEKVFHLSNYTTLQTLTGSREVVELMLAAALDGNIDEAKKISARVYRDAAPNDLLAAEDPPASNTETVVNKLTKNAEARPTPHADK